MQIIYHRIILLKDFSTMSKNPSSNTGMPCLPGIPLDMQRNLERNIAKNLVNLLTETAPFQPTPESSPGADDDSPRPTKKTKASNGPVTNGPMDLFFSKSSALRKKDIEFVMEKSPGAEIIGMKFSHGKADRFKKKMDASALEGSFLEAGKNYFIPFHVQSALTFCS